MKSVLIIGLGRFGLHMAEKMSQMRIDVMGVDRNEPVINRALPFLTDGQVGDSTEEAFLRSLGIGNFDLCMVTIGDNFQNSLETTYLLKKLGASRVVSVASGDRHAEFLLRNGADDVIYPERHMGEWAAIRYGADHVSDYFAISDEYAFFEVDVPDNWNGRTIGEINIRRNYNISIIGIRRDKIIDVSITADTVLRSSMGVLVLGKQKDVLKYFKI